MVTTKTFCFDLDGTLCTQHGTDYAAAQPMHARIEHVNALYGSGHRIVIHTARGSGTGLDHSELTLTQLKQWGLQYHDVVFGKPAADVYVDDRAVSDTAYEWDASNDTNEISISTTQPS